MNISLFFEKPAIHVHVCTLDKYYRTDTYSYHLFDVRIIPVYCCNIMLLHVHVL